MNGEKPYLTKLVITNRQALLRKYRRAGCERIDAALAAMKAADRRRGVRLVLAHVDELVAGLAPADDPMSQAQCKRAIDALYHMLGRPDYVLLLGGPDVIPFQDLNNPCARFGDPDAVVPSDLPYACDDGYGRDTEGFLAPTRVVGRLPDIPGSEDATYLVDLIRRAGAAPALDNKKCFAVSSREWKEVSQQVLCRSLAGPKPLVWVSPPYGPSSKKARLKRSFHFINCHGRPGNDSFSGLNAQTGAHEPAFDAGSIQGRLGGSAVVAVECSYGAQLQSAPRMSMASAYLREGAMAYVGSSTAAYGGVSGQDFTCADILCADFLAKSRQGASTGRAFLEARQSLLEGGVSLDPFRLKTLAQFLLLGDPSYRACTEIEAPRLLANALSEHHRRRNMLAADRTALKYWPRVPDRRVDSGEEMATLLAKMRLPAGAMQPEIFVLPNRADGGSAVCSTAGQAWGDRSVDAAPGLLAGSRRSRPELDEAERPGGREVVVIARIPQPQGAVSAVIARLAGSVVLSRVLVSSR